MVNIHELAAMIKELADQLISCMRCGMCQAVCPVFSETGRESDVARGKLALLDGLAGEILTDPESVSQRLNKCLLCGTCAANCPSGVNVLDIFLKARAILTGYQGLSAAKRVVFRGLLMHPALFNRVVGMGAKFQGVVTRQVNDMPGASCARFRFPVVGKRHFTRLAAEPLSVSRGGVNTPRGRSGVRAAVFIGCAIDKIFPRVGEAALRIMAHHGVGVFMPEGQVCCGIPVLSGGDADTFQALVRRNMDLFAKVDFDYLITACATCTATIREIWPVMYRGRGAQLKVLEALSHKAMDVNAFFTEIIGLKPAPAPRPDAAKVTYHDPCHLRNRLGVTRQPREVIRANPAYRFVEMAEAASCCGMGGSFSITHYDITESIGKRKAANVMATGAQIAAAGCPACMLQLTDMLSQQGGGVQVKHPIELYAETLV